MTPNMSKQVLRKVLMVQKLGSKCSGSGERKLKKEERERLEKLALEVVESYAGELDSKKLPQKPHRPRHC